MAKKVFRAPEELGVFFKAELAKKDSVFVFPTDVVKNSWIDWCVMHPEESGTDAVPLERFMAWDTFKGEAVRAKEEGKSSIPAILRKFFVNSLISENAQSPEQTPLFKKIINPQYKKEASSFTDWIAKMLPSLKLWNDKITKAESSGYKMDEEDEDFQTLYQRYSAFLEKNKFFEPSWIVPDFICQGKTYVIFYPEILEDYADYIEVFENTEGLTLVLLPETETEQKDILCNKYSDSRKELRRTILEIRKLAAGEKPSARWDQITLNVPDLESYRPYLERELTRYCVPFVIRAGFSLIKNTAGQIFKEIQDCYNSDFSYDSVRAFVLDEYIPWSEKYKEERQNLIRAGSELRCLCGFTEKEKDGKNFHFDSWEEALSAGGNKTSSEKAFYLGIKKDIKAICRAGSFKAIEQAWMDFRNKYLNLDEFSELADAIIGRCITELKKLIEIEEKYCSETDSPLKINKSYDFFVNELSNKTYTPQNKKAGVQIFPYKVTAGAAFNHQFIIDASQNNLEIQYKRLGFLTSKKRHSFGLEDDDKKFNASKAFVRLYDGLNDGKTKHFSYAEESFSGFAICHNSLKEEKAANDQLDNEDFILAEKNYMLGRKPEESGTEPQKLKLSASQKEEIKKWQFYNSPQENDNYSPSSILEEKIKNVLITKRDKNQQNSEEKIVLTQTDMKNFFPCPRKWIFSNVIRLEEDSLDTDLMQPFDMGNINHKILELFMKSYLVSKKPLPFSIKGAFENEAEIFEAVKEFTRQAINDASEDYSKSPLTRKMLEAQLDSIANHIMDFLHIFLQPNMAPEKINTRSKTEGYGGCYVKGVEKDFSLPEAGENYSYYGKLDLLLSPSLQNTDAEGSIIIDYKNSKIPAGKSIVLDDQGKLGDFQMPMYISLVCKGKNDDSVSVARFYSLKDASTSAAIDIFTAGKSSEDFKPVMEAFRQYSKDFADDISAKKLYPDSRKVDIFTDCIKCNFRSVCRHNYEVAKNKMTAQNQKMTGERD